MSGLNTQIEDMLKDYVPKEEKTINEPKEAEENAIEVEESGEPEDVEDVEGEPESEDIKEPEEVAEEEPEREEVAEEGEEDEPGEEEEEDELAALRAQINSQNELLLRYGIMPSGTQETDGAQTDSQEKASVVETPSGTFEILGEEESLDDVLNDRDSFTKWAQGFAQRIIQSGTQQYANRLPSVVAPQVRQIIDLNRAVDQFYSNNEDLLPVRSTVGAIGRQLATEHPEWSLPQLFEESGKKAREVLRMPAPGSGGKKKKTNPSFAKAKGGGRKPKPKISKLQREIDELL